MGVIVLSGIETEVNKDFGRTDGKSCPEVFRLTKNMAIQNSSKLSWPSLFMSDNFQM